MRTATKTLALAALLVATTGRAEGQTASLQVIHNAADPAAAVVDIYVNGDLFKDDFAFRTATPFLQVPAGVTLSVAVAPGTSTSVNEALATFPVTLETGKTYVAIANGVVGAAFAPNPDGESIAFNIFARDRIRTSSGNPNLVRLVAFHGATDAPTVDVRVRGGSESKRLFDDLTYGDFSGTEFVKAMDYVLDVTPGDDKDTVVASFRANLAGLGGGAAVVFASGFLNPAANGNGAAFGLFAALPTGDVAALPAYLETAQLQVIHNAADPAAAVVDIYVNGDLFKDDFAFRTATPFLQVPAGVTLSVAVAPGTSTSVNEALATFPVVLEANLKYVVMASGLVGGGFAPNPDGLPTGFNLFVKPGVRTETNSHLVKVLAFHGVTDAPSVDVRLRLGKKCGPAIFDDLQFGAFEGQVPLPAVNAILDVTPAGDRRTVLASYTADLQPLGGSSAVVFASGFLNPVGNNNGLGFGLFAALPGGQVVALPVASSKPEADLEPETTAQVALPSAFALQQNSPNPFNPATRISFALPEESRVRLQVFNAKGQAVRTLVNETLAPGVHTVDLRADDLPSGTYFYRIDAGSFSQTKKMILLK